MIKSSSTPHRYRIYVDLCIYISVCCFKLYYFPVFWLFLYAHSDTRTHTDRTTPHITYTNTHKHTDTHTHTHINAHKYTHTHTHTHAHTHTYTHVNSTRHTKTRPEVVEKSVFILIYFFMFMVFNFLIQSRRRRIFFLYIYMYIPCNTQKLSTNREGAEHLVTIFLIQLFVITSVLNSKHEYGGSIIKHKRRRYVLSLHHDVCCTYWVCCSVVQFVAVWCSLLQCGAVCCSVVQLVAVWCSLLQCFAVSIIVHCFCNVVCCTYWVCCS